jgi:hypothetical protein
LRLDLSFNLRNLYKKVPKFSGLFCSYKVVKNPNSFEFGFLILWNMFYFPLFTSATYFSKAPVIDGVPGLGAIISTRKPLSKASL